MPKRSKLLSEPPPWKMLLWTAFASVVFAFVGIGEIAEDMLRVARNGFHKHNASGNIVVVKIDDASLRTYGNWPWPRRNHALLVDRLTADGAKRIFFDINFSYPADRANDQAFADAIRRSGRVTLLSRSKVGSHEGTTLDSRPLPEFAKYAQVATASVQYNYQNAVWNIPYGITAGKDVIPSIAASASDRSGPADTQIPIDYSIKLSSIPVYSARDLLTGRIPAGAFANKQVLIGTDSDVVGDRYFIPGYGRAGGVYVHAIGAETLSDGRPRSLGWFVPLMIALAAAGLAMTQKRLAVRSIVFGATAALLLIVPIYLEANLIFVDVTPALFALMWITGKGLWQRYRTRGFINPVSNLPNLNALRVNRDGRNKALIAARIINYDEIVATLPYNSERQLVEQIVSRLRVGAPNRLLFQGDGGIFAWFEEPRQPFGNHLEALYALYRNPARVAGLPIDLSISFGVEVGSGRSLANRLASALVAAEEAAHHGLKWKYHDPESLEDASWKLSMLSQLDEAIDKGEVWVAYQPKLELATRRIIGAEALARWTHPDKGPIAASEFVAAAEQSNRIGKLTDFVLEQAVAAAAQINKRGAQFEIAVNLSARLLNDKGFILRLTALLSRHGLDPRHLTLELTETAAMAGNGEGLDLLARLRELGVRVSIDDYGTGLSTLDYLKKVTADEIKIDQSFVKGIIENKSDRLMVHSTIGLAHSLDRKVVAEGVEHREVLDLLLAMNCDIAQGFAIGRPMSLDSLIKRLATDRKRTAA